MSNRPLFSAAATLLLSLAPPTFAGIQPVSFHAPVVYGETGTAQSPIHVDLNRDGFSDIVYRASSPNRLVTHLGNGDGTYSGPTNYAATSTLSMIDSADLNGDGNRDVVAASNDGAHVFLGTGTGALSLAGSFPAILDPSSVSIADYNGDGRADLAISGNSSQSMALLFGNGDGTFQTAQVTNLGGQVFDLAHGDFNRDGRPDLALGLQGGVRILLNLGGGTFATGVNYSPILCFGIAIADLDGDGNLDIVASDLTNNQLRILQGLGDGSFSLLPTVYPVGTNPRPPAIADLNRDGLPDIVSSNQNTNNIAVLLSSGNFTFLPAQFINIGAQSYGVAATDINGDGLVDLAFSRQSASGPLAILLQRSVPQDMVLQTTPTAFATGSGAVGAAEGDFNGDGNLDVAVANFFANTVTVRLGNGAGGFGSANNLTGFNGPNSVAAADFNRDGRLDIAVANIGTDQVLVLNGAGDGTFGTPASYATPNWPTSVFPADFNGDGSPDLLTANQAGNNCSVLINNGSGAFAASVNYGIGGAPRDAIAADFNADGLLDVAVVGDAASSVSVLLGSGGGTLGSVQPFDIHGNAWGIVAGDFNRDGKPDLATANFSDGSVSVVTGTGTGAFSAPVRYAVGANPRHIAATDLNDDGILDLVSSDSGPGSASVLTGRADGTFLGAVAYAAGAGAAYTLTADFNKDGFPDLTTANVTDGNLTVRLNTRIHRNAKFTQVSDSAIHSGPRGISVGDLNRDGYPDLVVGSSTNAIAVRLGNASGNYTTASQSMTDVSAPERTVLADFNRDGNLDLAAVDWAFGANRVGVYLGTGTGTFSSVTFFAIGNRVRNLVAGDFNGDGNPDLAVGGNAIGRVSILLGNGSGGFAAPVHYSTGGGDTDTVATADFNGDGRLDIVTCDVNSGVNARVLLNAGSGTFGTAATYPASGSAVFAVATGDFNGDGRQDFVVNSYSAGTTRVYLGDGSGGFTNSGTYATGPSSLVLVAGDYNRDGVLDLISANANGTVRYTAGLGNGTFAPVVSIAQGESQTYSVAMLDADRDGRLDFASSGSGNRLRIFRNVGGQFRMDTTGVAPAGLAVGTTTSLLRVTASHAGITTDTPARLNTLEIGVTTGSLTPITSVEANRLITALSIWKDDGSGTFEIANDTLLLRRTTLDLDWKGRQSFHLPPTANTLLAPGVPQTYFVCVEKSPLSTSADTLRLTHITSGSSKAQDTAGLNPLSLEWSPDTASNAAVLPVSLSGFGVE